MLEIDTGIVMSVFLSKMRLFYLTTVIRMFEIIHSTLTVAFVGIFGLLVIYL